MISSGILLEYSKDFQIESNQIRFWIQILTEIKSQLTTLFEIVNRESSFLELKVKEFASKKSIFYSSSSMYSSEPSNFYNSLSRFINIIEYFFSHSKILFENINLVISQNSATIISNIDGFIRSILTTSEAIMKDVIQFKKKSHDLQVRYDKVKKDLELAQVEKKKIENDPNTMYNDIEKEKAQSKIIEQVEEIEKILPAIKDNAKKIELKKEEFNTHMKDTFEIVVMNIFKGIVYLHQFFFLIAKQKYEYNNQLKSKITQLMNNKNAVVTINDFTERKFAIKNNIFFEPIHFDKNPIDSIEMQNCYTELKEGNLLLYCDSYLYYTETFVKCMKIRKRIIKNFIEFIKEQVKKSDSQISSITNFLQITDRIKNLITVSQGTLKTWLLYESDLKNNFLNFKSYNAFFSENTIAFLENAAKETKKEYSLLNKNWSKYSKKITELKKNYIKLEEEIKKNNSSISLSKSKKEKLTIKEEKIRNFLPECYNYLSKNILNIREKDKHRINDIVNMLDNLTFTLIKKTSENLDNAKKEIENASNIDIFEEIKEVFSKYFDRFKISNGDNFIEMMKKKLLTKIDFDKDPLCQTTYDSLSSIYNMNNLNTSPMLSRLEEHQGGDCSDIIENKNLIREISGEKNGEQLKEIESSGSDSFEEIEKINFVNEQNFESIQSKNLNPYQNFKEKEIENIKTKIADGLLKKPQSSCITDRKFELEENEKLIEKYQCEYNQKAKGYLYITSQRIIFYNGKEKISIPLYDISNIAKVNSKQNPNAIEIKTNKITLYFKYIKEREICFININTQLEEIRKPSQDLNDLTSDNKGAKGVLKNQMINRIIELKDIIENKLHLLEKLKDITIKRIDDITANTDQSKFFFLPESEFERTYIDETDMGVKCPLPVVFYYLLYPNTIIDEYPHQKSFFESIYIDRGDLNMIKEYDESQDEKIPKFYADLDYVTALFANLDEKELDGFLSEIPNWEHKISYNLNFIHKIKKMIIGPDRLTVKDNIIIYFVSPTDLIIDYHTYMSDFPLIDTFITISQYRFHSDWEFNQKNGMIEFKLSVKIMFVIKMVKKCILESKLKVEGYKTNEDEVKYKIYEHIKNVLCKESEIFWDLQTKLCEENLRKILYKYSEQLPEEYKEIEEEEKKEEVMKVMKVEHVQIEKKEEDNNNENKKDENENEKDKENKNNKLYFYGIVLLGFLFVKVFYVNASKNNILSIDNLVNLILILAVGFLIAKVKK